MAVSSDVTTVTGQLVARAERDEYTEPFPVVKTEMVGAPWDVTTKRTAFLILLIVGAAIVWISQPVFPLLIVSGILSYFLSPIVDLVERLRIPRGVSTFVLYILVLVSVVLLPFIVGPVLLQQLQVITTFDVNRTATAILYWVSERLNSIPPILHILGFALPVGQRLQDVQQNFEQYVSLPNLTDILSSLQQLLGTATTVVGSTASFGLSVVGRIVQIFLLSLLTFFMSLYLTKDAPLIRSYVQGLFPRSFQPEFGELIRRIGVVWTSFFRGQLLLCLTIGVITWLAMELVGMPGALILGIIAGSLEIIPNLGPTLATIPAIIIALIQGSSVLEAHGINNLGFAAITAAIYFIIQQLENTIIVPRVIGSSVNLHPIVVICGVIIGFNLAGIWGAFFAAPVIASLRIVAGYVHAKLLDYPPFHGEPLRPESAKRPFVYRRTVTGEQLGALPPRTAGTNTGESSPNSHNSSGRTSSEADEKAQQPTSSGPK